MPPVTPRVAGSRCCKGRLATAFTLIELLAVVAIIALAASLVIPAVARAQERMRTDRCTRNLRDMGVALLLYTTDNSDKLPYAALRYQTGNQEHHLSWDDLLNHYLGGGISAEERSRDGTDKAGVLPGLMCPSDRGAARDAEGLVRHDGRRSYATAGHNMGIRSIGGRAALAADWPPSPVNQTGFGLKLDGRLKELSARWNPDDVPGAKAGPTLQPYFSQPTIFAAAETIFITEQLGAANAAGRWQAAEIDQPVQHRAGSRSTPAVHGQRVNYLMFDGHVENSLPADTGGRTNRTLQGPQSGQWTVLADD